MSLDRVSMLVTKQHSSQGTRHPRWSEIMMLQVLIADFFFICVALAWLAAGVAEKSSVNSTVSTFASLHLPHGVAVPTPWAILLKQEGMQS